MRGEDSALGSMRPQPPRARPELVVVVVVVGRLRWLRWIVVVCVGCGGSSAPRGRRQGACARHSGPWAADGVTAMTRRLRHCEFPDCGNFARRASRFCHEHRHTPVDDVALTARGLTYAEQLLADDAARRAARYEEFDRRLASGDYRTIYGAKVAGLIEQAAQQHGLGDERGALRVVLAVLVSELEDPEADRLELARTISTVTRAAAMVERGQRAASGELVSGLQEALFALLGEMDSDADE